MGGKFKFEFIIFLLILYLNYCESQKSQHDSTLPIFCSFLSPLTGDIAREEGSNGKIGHQEKSKRISVLLEKGETVCIRYEIKDKWRNIVNQSEQENETVSVLYAFQYIHFHQSHPIANRYTFGIPHLTSRCICDCPGGETRCSPNSQYDQCEGAYPTGSVCRRTYHANQASTGCSISGQASVCCDVIISSYKGWKFVAVDLLQSSPFGQLGYKLYYGRDGIWNLATNKTIQVPFYKPTVIDPDHPSINHFRISSFRPFHHLHPGMYFYQNSTPPHFLRSGPALNRLTEFSFTKVGWFRFNTTSSTWSIFNTGASLQQMLHVKVSNCKDQRYSESFQVGYATFDGDRLNFGDSNDDISHRIDTYIGAPLNDREIWISESKLSDDQRQVIIKIRDPPSIMVDFQLNYILSINNTLRFLHHESSFDDFRAEIRLDINSNRFLSLILINANGAVSGIIYENEKIKSNGISFLIKTENIQGEYQSLVELPNWVNSNRFICIRPNPNRDKEKCKWAEFRETPILEMDISIRNWNKKRGDCDGCNEENGNLQDFFTNLNPKQWFNGISGISEWMAFGSEIAVYILGLILIYALFRRLLCPLVKWAICKDERGGNDKD